MLAIRSEAFLGGQRSLQCKNLTNTGPHFQSDPHSRAKDPRVGVISIPHGGEHSLRASVAEMQV